MNMGAIVLSVVFCVVLLVCGIMVFVVAKYDDMSDKEREQYGLGPRGQGKGR